MKAVRYVALRLLGMIGTLLVVSVLTYAVFYLLPADPAQLSCGRPCTPQRLAEASAFMGYDKPWTRQYLDFLGGIVAGRHFGSGLASVDCAAPCFGYSFRLNQPVTQLIVERAPVTFSIAGGAALLWLVIGVGAGVLAAVRRGTAVDRAAMLLSTVGVSAPSYLVALLGILLFGFTLNMALLRAVPKLAELRLWDPSTTSAAGAPEPIPAPRRTPAAIVGTVRNGQPPEDAVPPPAVVRLRDVVVEYPGRRGGDRVRAVDRVSLRIERGQVLGLVGESGSGKSTIGRVLAGLVPVVAGTVLVGGTDVGEVARRPWRHARVLRRVRSEMGVVFQDPASSLSPRQTVADSVAEPLVLHRDLDATALRQRVDELLEAVQLAPTLRDRYPYEMSGGQRQRVAIARALALDPALLIADEPTSALDVSVQARILELFRSLQDRFGFACLFISHDLAVVEQLAHRLAVMHRGRIVEQGPTPEVLRAPAHPYTRRLLAAAPTADPQQQAARRAAWRRETSGSSDRSRSTTTTR
ncbi:ATP-binding cassette domain-containing protein [Micromonospora sp. NBC_01699]|uniref:ATP-binding cassette domain-containing protein n=1 Tax=Micromonospora sp. NBC_01699 TaxID=2975984 RepID=UPI002E2B4B12|nr:ATP-binding cassette domain-containing protein [Micromonospora sp. NBC_01699]